MPLNRDLDSICLKCLEKDRPARYRTAAELADDLTAWLEERPVRARPIGPIGRLWRWSRRNRAVAGLSAGITASLVVGTIVASWLAIERNAAARKANTATGVALQFSDQNQRLFKSEQDARRNAERARTDVERANRHLERALRTAHAQRWAAESVQCLDQSPQRSLLLAAQAVESTWRMDGALVPEAHAALRRSLEAAGGDPYPDWGYGVCRIAGRNRLVVGRADHTLVVCDADREDLRDETVVLRGHTDHIVALAASRDGRWLVSASWDATARVWDLDAPDPNATVRVLRGHDSYLTDVDVSDDGKWCVTAGIDLTVRRWNLSDPNGTPKPAVYRGHETWEDSSMGAVEGVRLVADGNGVLSVGEDGTLRSWDPKAFFPSLSHRVPVRIKAMIQRLELLDGGRRIAIASTDARVRVLDSSKFNVIAELSLGDFLPPGRAGSVDTLAVSSDGRWLVAGGGVALGTDAAVVLWELSKTGSVVSHRALTGHVGRVSCAEFDGDGARLVTGGVDGTCRVWDLTASDPAAAPLVLRGHEGHVDRVCFHRDGAAVFSAAADGAVRRWALSRSSAAHPVILGGHERAIVCAGVAADGRVIVTAGNDGRARFWRTGPHGVSGDALALGGGNASPTRAEFDDGGRWLAIGREDGTVDVWDLSEVPGRGPLRVLSGAKQGITSIAYPAGTSHIVAGSADGTVRIRDLQRKDDPDAVLTHGTTERVWQCATSPRGRWLLTTGDKRTVLRDLSQGIDDPPSFVLDGHESGILSFAFVGDDAALATQGFSDSHITWWKLDGERPGPRRIDGSPDSRVEGLAVSPDGRFLAFVNRPRRGDGAAEAVQVHEVSRQDPSAVPIRVAIPAPSAGYQFINDLRFSPRGRWLCACASGGRVFLWDARSLSAASVPTVIRPDQGADFVAFSRDEQWMATCRADEATILWHLTSDGPAPSGVRLAGTGFVSFTHDGRWILQKIDRHSLGLWPLEPDDLIRAARRVAGRALTAAERDQFSIPPLPAKGE